MKVPTQTEDLYLWQRRHAFEAATENDQHELQAACWRVWSIMRFGGWVTRAQIVAAAKQDEGMRRMQDLKQLGYKVVKLKVTGARAWLYRLETGGD